MKEEKIVNQFIKELSEKIKDVPKDFYDTFKFTKTGNNFTHPRTLGFIYESILKIKGFKVIDIDCHINDNGKKLQPDILVRNRKGQIILMVDYESPNSSDARIPEKDIIPYVDYINKNKLKIPYIIITTLPKKKTNWKLMYTEKGYYNRGHKGKIQEIRKNPFRYWYGFYKKKLKPYKKRMKDIYMFNINNNKLRLEKI